MQVKVDIMKALTKFGKSAVDIGYLEEADYMSSSVLSLLLKLVLAMMNSRTVAKSKMDFPLLFISPIHNASVDL